jgi:hypothetical protein
MLQLTDARVANGFRPPLHGDRNLLLMLLEPNRGLGEEFLTAPPRAAPEKADEMDAPFHANLIKEVVK